MLEGEGDDDHRPEPAPSALALKTGHRRHDPLANFFRGRRRFYNRFTYYVQHFHMIALIRNFRADTSGATAIEYGLIAEGISVAIIVGEATDAGRPSD